MFYSQRLLSSKGPLGAIWVAAYFFKKLKKSQVKETDICSSVDKILIDGVDDVTYRILGYLLLGIVRIYSRKVEYLFHDCNEVLSDIKKFMANAKEDGLIETLLAPSCSISLPKRFELDAFDLEIHEDVYVDNIVCNEAITLKDIYRKDEGMSLIPLDTYNTEEFDVCQNTCTSDPDMALDIPQYQMDANFHVDAGGTSVPMGLFKHGDKQEDRMQSGNVKTCCGVENEHATATMLSEDHLTTSHSMTSQEIVPSEDASTSEASMEKLMYSKISQEPADILIFCDKSGWPVHEDDVHQATSNKMHQDKVIEDISEAQLMEVDLFSGTNEIAENDVGESTNKGHGSEDEKRENVIRNEGKNQINIPESMMLEKTSHSEVPLISGGATSPEFMMIPTPAVMERAPFSRKRKRSVDESLVLSNEAIRQSITDTSDLVSKRRKCPPTLLAAWRLTQISNLSQSFFKPIIPCRALEFKFPIFKNVNISETTQAIPTENLEVSQSVDNAGLGNTTTARVNNALQSPCRPVVGLLIDRSENIATAPPTPPQLSKDRPVESPSTLKGTERPSSSTESLEDNRSLIMNEELNCTEEELNSFEMEDKELNGWSAKTRMVVRFLHKNFFDMRRQREEEIVNLLQVLGRRTKKECATVFYEILVLGTKGYVDVKQTNAHGDISVSKLPKWDNTFGSGTTCLRTMG